jgi:hypothetical protein
VVDPVALVTLLAAYALLFHVRLDVGGGSAVATQLAFVPMLFVLPPALAPALVIAAWPRRRGGRAARWSAPRAAPAGHERRLVRARPRPRARGGPARRRRGAAPWVLGAALVAQFAGDVAWSAVRERQTRGIPPSLQLRVMAPVMGVDTALSAVGLLAAHATGRWAALPALPQAAVFAGLAADRRRRLDQLVARGEQLELQRGRLHDVIRETGRAFAASMDRRELVDAILAAAVGGLGARAGRIGLHDPEGGKAHRGDGCDAALAAAERAAIWDGRRRGGGQRRHARPAVALAEAGASAPVGTLAVRPRGQPFTDAEREVLAALGAQAAVAVHNAQLQALVARQAVTDE